MKSSARSIGWLVAGGAIGLFLAIGQGVFAERTTEGTLPLEDLRTFTEVFAKIKSDYVEPIEDKALLENAIRGMLSGLDPHSSYLIPDDYQELQAGTSGEFGGLGIEVGLEDGFVKVIAPIDDTPAQRAGVEAGDLVIRLDDTPVKGMSLAEAVKVMRGPPGTDIVLTIVREGVDRPLRITITRDVIRVTSVRSRSLEPGYGYIRISQFQLRTGESLREAVDELRDPGTVRRTHHQGHPRQRSQLPGSTLRVATGHDDPCRRMLTGDSPDGFARRGVGPCGHAAGIHDIDIGGVARTDGFEIASVVYEGADCFRIVLIQPAPEGAIRDSLAHDSQFRLLCSVVVSTEILARISHRFAKRGRGMPRNRQSDSRSPHHAPPPRSRRCREPRIDPARTDGSQHAACVHEWNSPAFPRGNSQRLETFLERASTRVPRFCQFRVIATNVHGDLHVSNRVVEAAAGARLPCETAVIQRQGFRNPP